MKRILFVLSLVTMLLVLICSYQIAGGSANQPVVSPLGSNQKRWYHSDCEQYIQNLGKKKDIKPAQTSLGENESGENDIKRIDITVGKSVFTVILYDNHAANALLKRLPMTVNMSELNGNEKYYYLPDNLPADSQQVGSIQSGDLMLYGSDCLVLFYEGFNTSYSYTKLGYIEDVSGLVAALGSGGVKVKFTVNENEA